MPRSTSSFVQKNVHKEGRRGFAATVCSDGSFVWCSYFMAGIQVVARCPCKVRRTAEGHNCSWKECCRSAKKPGSMMRNP
eukprot:3181655-Amphidinium_carterae.2